MRRHTFFLTANQWEIYPFSVFLPHHSGAFSGSFRSFFSHPSELFFESFRCFFPHHPDDFPCILPGKILLNFALFLVTAPAIFGDPSNSFLCVSPRAFGPQFWRAGWRTAVATNFPGFEARAPRAGAGLPTGPGATLNSDDAGPRFLTNVLKHIFQQNINNFEFFL